jgi:iron complex transport system ATP-binding protein
MDSEGPGEVESALEVVGLRDRADQPLATLSGGQQQRVAFARALHHHRAGGALLLDEPWSGVDPPEAARLAYAVRDVARSGSTVLVAVHDLSMAAAVADHAWCLRDGRLAAAGDARRVLTEEVVATALGTRVRIAAGENGARVMAIDYPATLRLGRESRPPDAP